MTKSPYEHLQILKNGTDSFKLLSSYMGCRTTQPDIIMKCVMKMNEEDASQLLKMATEAIPLHKVNGKMRFDKFIKLMCEIQHLSRGLIVKLLVYVFTPIMHEFLGYCIQNNDFLDGNTFIKAFFINVIDFPIFKLCLLESFSHMSVRHFKTYPKGFLKYSNYCKTISFEFLKCFEASVPRYVDDEIKSSFDMIRQSCYSQLSSNVDLPFSELSNLRLPINITWQMYESLKSNYSSKSFEWVAYTLFKSKNSLEFISKLVKDIRTDIKHFLVDPVIFTTLEQSIANLNSHLQQKFIKKSIKLVHKHPCDTSLQLALYLFLCIYQSIDLYLYFKRKLKKYSNSNAFMTELSDLITKYPSAHQNTECTTYYQIVDQVECGGSNPTYEELSGPFNDASSSIQLDIAVSAAQHVNYNSKQAQHLSRYFDHYFTLHEQSVDSTFDFVTAISGLCLHLDYVPYNSYTMNICAFSMKKNQKHLKWLNEHSCHSNKSISSQYQQLVQMKHDCISMQTLYSLDKQTISEMSKLELLQLLVSITELLIIKRKLAVQKSSQVCIIISYIMPYCYNEKEMYKCLHAIYAPPLKRITGINSFHRDFIKPFQFHTIAIILPYIKNYTTWYSDGLQKHILKLLDLYTGGYLKRRNALLEMLFDSQDKEVMKGLLIKSKAYNTMEQ
eukprot:NODE_19_length_39463_cov_0.396073.p2 type:complete len:670 gc:universal NODE_19_length_39463_cov_0.396073:18225-20234(+)